MKKSLILASISESLLERFGVEKMLQLVATLSINELKIIAYGK